MHRVTNIGLAAAAIAAVVAAALTAQAADNRSIARGRYLVTFGGCGDCHTPGYFAGKPDMARSLAGSDVGFEVGNLGVFYGPNLTPDKATGLGNWSRTEIVTAITTGQRPDGRELAPIMPWRDFAALTKSDALAIADYLKALPPVRNKAPGPFGPSERPSSPFMRTIAP